MKKLVQITTVANSGSVGRIAEEIGQLACHNGWKSIIAYGRNTTTSNSDLIRIGNNRDVKLHGAATRMFDAHGFYSKHSTIKFINQLDKIQPNIVHLHNIHGYYLNIEILFNYLATTGVPVVWTMHDCWAVTGHCAHFEYAKCDKWQTGCHACSNKHAYPRSFISRAEKNYSRKKELFSLLPKLTIVPVCNWLSDILKKSFLADKAIKVIYNGIDLNVFSPKNPEALAPNLTTNNRFVIIAVSSVWNQSKGWHDLIELNKMLSNDEQLVVVGVSAKQQKQLPRNVIAIQRTENVHQLAELYSCAGALINPTYQDTLPTVNIESIACGTPVITYKTGGSADIINNDTGFVTPVGDIVTAYNAMQKIKRNGKNSYSNNCRNRAETLFNKDERFTDYIDLYESML